MPSSRRLWPLSLFVATILLPAVVYGSEMRTRTAVEPLATCGTTVVTGPSDTGILLGQSATLTVTATGGTTFTYRWYAGAAGDTTSPVPGDNASTLTIAPAGLAHYWVSVTNECGNTANSRVASLTVTPANSTSYWVVIGDSCGASTTSSTATVTVSSATPPSISFTASPISITAGQSSTLSWSVTNATTVSIDH